MALADDLRATLNEFDSSNRGRGLGRTLRANNAAYAAQVLSVNDVNAMINQIPELLSGNLATVVDAMADSLAKAVRNRPAQMKKIFTQVAQDGQDAILRAYDEHYGRSTPYRWDDEGKWRRYSNHALRNALASPSLYHVTPDGLDFILGAFLDEKARQWYRLNFGAAPRGSLPHSPTMMSFFGQEIEGGKLEGGPGKGFTIPAGFFSDTAKGSTPSVLKNVTPFGQGRGQPFYPAALITGGSARLGKASGRKLSQGILGTRYLDAGVDAINLSFPRQIELLTSSWMDEARAGAGGSTIAPLIVAKDQLSAAGFTRIQSQIRKGFA